LHIHIPAPPQADKALEATMYTLPIIVGVCIVMSFALPVLAWAIMSEVNDGNSGYIMISSARGAFKWTCIATATGLIGLACVPVPYAVMLTSKSYDYQLWVIILSIVYFVGIVSCLSDD